MLDDIDFDFDFEEKTDRKESKFDTLNKVEIETDTEKDKERDTLGKDESKKEEKVTNKNILKIEDAMGVSFSEEQKDIIQHTGSPLGVVSGAGSGKTTVLVSKMVYRELEHNIKPLNMLAITFTADATVDMKEKYKEVRRKTKLKRRGMATFKTFHALFLMLLTSMDEYKNMKVVNGNEYKYLLAKYVKGSDEEDKQSVIEQMFSYRGAVINRGISTDGIENAEVFMSETVNFKIDNYKEIMKKYNDLKTLDGVIDFDDMQTLLYDEIVNKENKEPVKSFRRVWGNGDVYIDEYQDISKVQRDIMDKLIKNFNRLTVIGDDDQSIYSFRGSDPKYILDFPFTYSRAELKYLSTNYRCGSNILNAVKPVIENNKNRMEKDIKAFNEGGEVKLIKTKGNNAPLIDEIKYELEGLDTSLYEFIAVLVRNNSQRMVLADELLENDVAVNIKNTKFSLQENKFYNTLLDIIEMIKEEDNKMFVTHCRKLFPHIRKTKIDFYLYSDENWYEDLVEKNKYNVRSTDISLIKKIKETNNMFNAFVGVWKLVRLYYKNLGDRGFGSFKRVEDIMRYVLKISKNFKINDYMEKEEKKYAKLRLWCGSSEALEISTIHSVKGLEYDTVFFVGVDNDIIPNESRYDDMMQKRKFNNANNYIEEERRLFYVAWTRAIHKLVVTYDAEKPSRFISEL